MLSTRYGKIEDLILSLRVVTPTGEIVDTLVELRSTLEETVDELRAIMADLRPTPTAEHAPLKNQAA